MTESIAVYGGSFDPPHLGHILMAKTVAACERIDFKEVVMPPCGLRADKPETDDSSRMHRSAMCDIAFSKLDPKIRVDLFDLERKSFSRQVELQERYAAGGKDVWHVVGSDLVKGGARGDSDIQKKWFRGRELWRSLQYVVVRRVGHPMENADLPPRSIVIDLDASLVNGMAISSHDVRNLVFRRHAYEHLVTSEVHSYIDRYNLYRPGQRRTSSLQLTEHRPHFVFDADNPKALAIFKRYEHLHLPLEFANCIVVVGGDGFMLRAVRELWRSRLPFVGINAGHVGYLLNDEETFGALPELLSNLRVHLQAQLAVEIETLDGQKQHDFGFNDAWVRDTGQAAWLDIKDDVYEFQLIGDGALVCTPAGSTGYSWSMGAQPMAVDDNNLQITGHAVSSPRGWKSMQYPRTETIEIIPQGGEKRRVQGYVDGRPYGLTQRMVCKSSNVAGVELAFSPDRDLFGKLRDQLTPVRRRRRSK